jgi:hypothetical protein
VNELQAFIDAFKQPHPEDHPRLKRVINASLQMYVPDGGEAVEVCRWAGQLVLSQLHVRFVTAQIIGTLAPTRGTSHSVMLAMANTGKDARMGIQGAGPLTEWATEDVRLEPEYTSWIPENHAFLTAIYNPPNSPHFDLQMTFGYQFGG